MNQVKVKGTDIYVDGVIVGRISGSRDPKGLNHRGYWIRLLDGSVIGYDEKFRNGCWAYFDDARKWVKSNPNELMK